MDQEQIRRYIEKLISKSEQEIDKVWAERLKEILSQLMKLIKYVEGKDPHIGWTEINKGNRLLKELKKIEESIEGDHSKVARIINNLKSTAYLESILRHSYLFGQATKTELINALPSDKVIKKALEQPIKFIKLDESLRKQRKRTLQRIRADITLGIMSGEGFSKIAKRLRISLGMTAKQSKRVARTEGGRAMEQAGFESAKKAKSLGARMQKRWNATFDLRTRPTHQVLDHQVREIDEYFESSGCKALHPKVFTGPNSAGENINCRCTIVYIINGVAPSLRRAKDEKGKSIAVPDQSYVEWRKTLEKNVREAHFLKLKKEQKETRKQMNQMVEDGIITLIINPEKQNRHMLGHNLYDDYKTNNIAKGKPIPSYFDVSLSELNSLYEQKKSSMIYLMKNDGQWSKKAYIDLDKEVGSIVEGNKVIKTSLVKVHFSKTGTHLVPYIRKE